MSPSFDKKLLDLIWVDYNKLNDVLGLDGAWSGCPRALQFSFAIPALAIGIKQLFSKRELSEFEKEVRRVEEMLFNKVREVGVHDSYCFARSIVKRESEFKKWDLYLSEFGDSQKHSDSTRYSIGMVFGVIYSDRLNAYQKDYERGLDWFIKNTSSSKKDLNEVFGPFPFLSKRFLSDIKGVESFNENEPNELVDCGIGHTAFASHLFCEFGLRMLQLIDND